MAEDRAHLPRSEVEHPPAARVGDERALGAGRDEIGKLSPIADQRVGCPRPYGIGPIGGACFRREAGERAGFHFLNFPFSAAMTFGGAKGEASPPMEAICRTSVAVIGRTGEEAGRKTVRSSGAIAPFMPAICIS